jgi:hypothetical protein
MKSMTTREPVRAGNSGAAGDWAICCSGGGIRSAAYCLGALQSLGQDGLVAKARWILGVSGGSYIAASRALVAHDLPQGTQPRAYASGTPEERNLRYDTRYIAPNLPTILVGVLSLLLGAIGTLVGAHRPGQDRRRSRDRAGPGHDDPRRAQAGPGQVVRPWAHGRFRRPQPVPGLPDEGDIWVCKLGWWTGAPWDVLAYARQHPTYPCDSTLEQLYDATEFEAYHQLGAAAVLGAAEHCEPPLAAPSPGVPAIVAAGPPASPTAAITGWLKALVTERR